jgi:dihydrofolate reductase
MKTALIVAHAKNYAIGINNALPWYIPEDLKWFKAVTMGKPIIMGRKTFDSIGRGLPGRTNIVVTRDQTWSSPGIKVAHSLTDAIELAQAIALIDGVDECMIIGGGQIYAEAMHWVDRMYVTLVDVNVDNADAFFPAWNEQNWHLVDTQAVAAKGPDRPACVFNVLDAKSSRIC